MLEVFGLLLVVLCTVGLFVKKYHTAALRFERELQNRIFMGGISIGIEEADTRDLGAHFSVHYNYIVLEISLWSVVLGTDVHYFKR